MVGFLQFIAGLGAIAGGVVLFIASSSHMSAPQEAAAAAFAIGLAVVPYVLMRCVQLARDEERRQKEHAALLAALGAPPPRDFQTTKPGEVSRG
jgi:uncharacterized membrane protein